MEQVYDSEESSSGCESGWTLYLDIPHDEYFSSKKDTSPHEHDQEYDDGDEDDNMSMVSDASSGPPHFHEHQERDEDEDEYSNNNNDKSSIRVFCDPTLALGSRKRRKVLNQTCFQDLPDFHDDTASSPLFGFSNVSTYISFDYTFSLYFVGWFSFVSK